MPSAAEFQALSDELRQLGAVIVQAANLAKFAHPLEKVKLEKDTIYGEM